MYPLLQKVAMAISEYVKRIVSKLNCSKTQSVILRATTL